MLQKCYSIEKYHSKHYGKLWCRKWQEGRRRKILEKFHIFTAIYYIALTINNSHQKTQKLARNWKITQKERK